MSTTPAASPAQSATSVTELWYTRCPVPTGSSLAISQGWLEDEFSPDDIAISSLRASTDRNVRESHFDHTQENSFRQGGNIPPIWSRSRGNDLRVIGLSWVPEFQAIVAMPESGLDGPERLRGRRIAVPRRLNDKIDFWRANVLHGLQHALDAAGLTLEDVTLVDLPIEERFIRDTDSSSRGSLFGAVSSRQHERAEVLALIRGEVDAMYVKGGRGPDLQALADVRIVYDIAAGPWERQVGNIQPATLTVSGRLVDERPDLVARYLAATIRAARWAREHRELTTQILAHEVGVAEDFVEPAYTSEITRLLEPSLDGHLVDALEAQKRFLLQAGFIERDFDVQEWIAPEPLQEALEIVEAQG